MSFAWFFLAVPTLLIVVALTAIVLSARIDDDSNEYGRFHDDTH